MCSTGPDKSCQHTVYTTRLTYGARFLSWTDAMSMPHMYSGDGELTTVNGHA